MANILIFGTSSVGGVPIEVVEWLKTYLSQRHNFIVGDKKGLDCTIHRTLSSIGALDNTTIYCMDKPNNNLYEIKSKNFITYYNAETKEASIHEEGTYKDPYIISGIEKEMDVKLNRQWYEFRDKQMIEDCDMAICLVGEENKTVIHMIQLLNIKDKPCYCVKVM